MMAFIKPKKNPHIHTQTHEQYGWEEASCLAIPQDYPENIALLRRGNKRATFNKSHGKQNARFFENAI